MCVLFFCNKNRISSEQCFLVFSSTPDGKFSPGLPFYPTKFFSSGWKFFSWDSAINSLRDTALGASSLFNKNNKKGGKKI